MEHRLWDFCVFSVGLARINSFLNMRWDFPINIGIYGYGGDYCCIVYRNLLMATYSIHVC